MWLEIGKFLLFAVLAFVQSMSFTWTSRSRNSGDPTYHRYASLCSNGIWLLTNSLYTSLMISVHQSGQWWKIVVFSLVYLAAMTEGSVFMMRILLRREQGKHRVGAMG